MNRPGYCAKRDVQAARDFEPIIIFRFSFHIQKVIGEMVPPDYVS